MRKRARGLPHSKTLPAVQGCNEFPQVLECASPLALCFSRPARRRTSSISQVSPNLEILGHSHSAPKQKRIHKNSLEFFSEWTKVATCQLTKGKNYGKTNSRWISHDHTEPDCFGRP